MDPVLLRLERDELRVLDRSLSTEWLETDGAGGYAAGTSLFCPTRRQHGLLVAAPEGNPRHHVFLSRWEETAFGPDGELALSMARYPGAFAPLGVQHIASFELAPWPTSVYASGAVEVHRELLALRGGGVLVRYENAGRSPFELELRPMLAAREADALTFENRALRPEVEEIPGGIVCRPYAELPALVLTSSRAETRFEYRPTWYKNVEYSADAARGEPHREDQFSPGAFRVALGPGQEVVLAAALERAVKSPRTAWRKASEARLERVAAARARAGRAGPAGKGADVAARGLLAADAFLRDRPAAHACVDAAFPPPGAPPGALLGERGRDRFLALPGLTLARGELEPCGAALCGALDHLQDGLLPSVFGPARRESSYDAADVSLWFARAAFLYEQAGGEEPLVQDALLPALEEIGEAYWSGTRLGIRADEAGLLQAGDEGSAVTWMDARTREGPVTPRDGCAVELNALWYALVAYLERLHEAAGRKREHGKWAARRRALKQGFQRRFAVETGGLADVWKDGRADPRVRPNMVIAAALELSPLTKAQRAAVVERAEAELLTPFGLRTLSPHDPAYRPHAGGNADERAHARHQGSVWPWLLGFHVEARLRAHGSKKAQRAELLGLWRALEQELDRGSLNHLSELHDGDAPHRAAGAGASACNTAELLRSRHLLA